MAVTGREVVPLIDVCGIVTPTTAGRLLADNAAWQLSRPTLVQVVRYDRAVMCIEPEQLFASAHAVQEGLEVVTALVVQQQDCAMFREYAQMMIQAGRPRRVFSDVESAVRWATLQQQIERRWLAERAHPTGSVP